MAGDSDKDEPAPAVPKFSSFKPKGPSSSKAPESGSDKPMVPKFSSYKSKDPPRTPRGNERRSRDERHRKHRDEHERHEDRNRRHRSERHHDRHDPKRRRHDDQSRHERRRHRSRSPHELPEQPRKPPARDPKQIKSDLFFFDTKGDPLITKYGGIERSKIPIYRRYGGGRVLGTNGRLVIHRDGPRDQFSLRMPGEWSGLSRDGLRVKKSYLKQEGVRLRPYKAKVTMDQEEEEGFLRLGRVGKHDAISDDSSNDDGDEQPNYRSIEGKAKAKSVVDSESSDESESEDDVPLEQSDPLRWRSVQLSRRVKDQPQDIEAWIQLADHQDTLLRAGQTMDHQIVEDEVHSFTEIKLSILESALGHAANEKDRRRVLKYLMREGPKVWSSKTTAKRWEQLKADEEENFILWRTHLDFEMSNIATFSYDSMRSMLCGRLAQCLSRCESPSASPTTYFEAIHIFLRLTRFVHDAGFKELATATWQAMLELNFYRPDGFEDTAVAMGSLQDFWESEVPRIGEPDAQGWQQFVESRATGEPPEPLQASIPPAKSALTCKAWSEWENHESQRSSLPARTMDEGNDDDPYRVVMFSDIEPFLFLIPDSFLAYARDFLLDAFLIFSGLPPSNRSLDWTEAAWQDHFLTGSRSSVLGQETKPEAQQETEEVMPKAPAFSGLDVHAVCETEVLFPGKGWLDLLNRSNQSLHISQNWVHLVFRQLVLSAGIESHAPYYLALSTLDEATTVKKTGKAVLKKFPRNAVLYKAYALAEYVQGNRDTATKVLQSATSIFEVTGESGQGDGLQLWHTWAWIDLESGSKSLALKRLCSAFDKTLRTASDDVEPTSTHILYAREGLSGGHGNTLPGYINAVNKSCVLLEYLTDGNPSTEPTSLTQGNISHAMDYVDRMSNAFKLSGEQDSASHESLLQFAARLLYLHATKGPFRREYLSRTLLKYLALFPRNTIFFSLLEWSDSSLRIIDSTRTILHDQILIPPRDCMTSRLFAIHHEITHGNVHTTRTAFENAVGSDACRCSPQVWISYIRFCQGHREIRAKAKDVFYRALRHCPWSKGVMMEAFVTLGGVMDERELRSVYRTMEEKGLRIHVDLEYYLKG